MQLVSSVKTGTAHSASVAAGRQMTPRPFDGARSKRGHLRQWSCNNQAPFAFELDSERLRLDLNHAVTPANLQWRSRLERGFPTDFAGNDQAARSIHGRYHGRYFTII